MSRKEPVLTEWALEEGSDWTSLSTLWKDDFPDCVDLADEAVAVALNLCPAAAASVWSRRRANQWQRLAFSANPEHAELGREEGGSASADHDCLAATLLHSLVSSQASLAQASGGGMVAASLRGLHGGVIGAIVVQVADSQAVASRLRMLASLVESRSVWQQPACAPEELHDIQRSAERTRIQHEALLGASQLQTMGELIAGIAHEMTQPLGAIANYAAAMNAVLDGDPGERQEATAELTRWAAAIATQVKRAGTIIDRMRRFSRRNTPRRSTYDLNVLLEEAIRLHRSEADRHGVQLRCRLSGEPLPIVADELQVHQALACLLRNAFEALDDSPHDERWVVVQSSIVEGHAVATIEDNGPGVSPAIAPTMFDPFSTTKADRLGIGLSCARSIATSNHGRVWAEPNPAVGSVLCLAFPLSGR